MIDMPPIVTNIASPRRHLDKAGSLASSSTPRPCSIPKSSPRKSQPTSSPICAPSRVTELQGPIGLENIRQDLRDRADDALRRQGQRPPDQDAGAAMRRLALVAALLLAPAVGGAGADRRSQCADPRGGASATGARAANRRDPHRALGRAGPAHHGDELHPLHRRAVVPALGPRACKARRPTSC